MNTPIYDRLKSGVCGSRGPRIGEEGSPRCAKPFGHAGNHQGFEGSGFEREFWGEPIMRDMEFVKDWALLSDLNRTRVDS